MEASVNSSKTGIKELLPYKGYMISLSANFISRIGDSLDSIAYGWMVYILTGSKLLLGTLFAVNAIPNIIFSPFVGPLVDRLPKKRIVIITNIGRGVVVSLTAALFYFNALKPWHLFVFTFINSTFEAINMPSGSALFPMLIPKELFLTANSFSTSVSKIAELSGLALAAVIISVIGISGAIFIDGLTFFTAALMVSFIKVSETIKDISDLTFSEYFTDLKSGLLFIKNHSIILISITLFAVVNFCVAPINVLEPVFVKDVLKSGPEFQSVLGICTAVGMIVGGIGVAQYGSRFKISTCVIAGFLVFGISYSLLIIPGNLTDNILISRIVSAVIYGLIGLVMPVASSPISSYVISNTPREMVGRVSSVLNMLCLCAIPLGSFITGALCEYISMQTMFFAMGICIALVAVLLLLNKNFRNA